MKKLTKQQREALIQELQQTTNNMIELYRETIKYEYLNSDEELLSISGKFIGQSHIRSYQQLIQDYELSWIVRPKRKNVAQLIIYKIDC